MVVCHIRNYFIHNILYCQGKCKYKGKFMERKLMRNGNGWALSINSTILQLLKLNPETDLVEYNVENNKLIITKSPNKRTDIK